MRGLEYNMQPLSKGLEMNWVFMSFHFVIEFQKGIHSWVLLFSAFCISAVWYIKCVPGEEFVHGLLCVGKSSAKKIIVGIFCTPKVDWRACALKVEHFNLLVGQLYVAVNQVFVRDLCSAHFATIAATQNLKFQRWMNKDIIFSKYMED